jgi:hypothetical protein
VVGIVGAPIFGAKLEKVLAIALVTLSRFSPKLYFSEAVVLLFYGDFPQRRPVSVRVGSVLAD